MSPPQYLKDGVNLISRRRRLANSEERMVAMLRAHFQASRQWNREIHQAERRQIHPDYCHASKNVLDDHVMDWS